jgi:hypothetical protein
LSESKGLDGLTRRSIQSMLSILYHTSGSQKTDSTEPNATHSDAAARRSITTSLYQSTTEGVKGWLTRSSYDGTPLCLKQGCEVVWGLSPWARNPALPPACKGGPWLHQLPPIFRLRPLAGTYSHGWSIQIAWLLAPA